jgi:hypothetical protein
VPHLRRGVIGAANVWKLNNPYQELVMAKQKSDTPTKKTTCPITKEEFLKNAKPVEVVINGVPHVASVKEFSTGSFGWYLNGKTAIKVGDVALSVQIGLNLTAVGSKESK